MDYGTALRTYLPRVLQNMLMSGKLSEQARLVIEGNQQLWVSNFIGMLGQGISSEEFMNSLEMFLTTNRDTILNNYYNNMQGGRSMGNPMMGNPMMGNQMMRGPMMGGMPLNMPQPMAGYPQPMMGNQPMGYPHHQMGIQQNMMGYNPAWYNNHNQNIPTNVDYGGANCSRQPVQNIPINQPQPSRTTELLNKVAEEKSKTVPKTIAPHRPAWVSNLSLLKRYEPIKFGEFECHETDYPEDDVEYGVKSYLFESTTTLGSIGDICNIIKMLIGSNDRVMAKVSHLKAIPIRCSDKEMLTSSLEKLKALLKDSGNTTPVDKLYKLKEVLGTFPQVVYTALSSLIEKRVDTYLKGRVIQSDKNYGYTLGIDNLDALLLFDPNARNTELDMFTKANGYDVGFETMLKGLYTYVSKLEVNTTSVRCALAAAKSLRGSEGVKWTEILSSDDDTRLEQFLESYTVITVPEEFIITNMDLEETQGTASLFATKASCVLPSAKSGNFDYIIAKISNKVSEVYDMDGIRMLIIGSTLSSSTVYAKPEE